MIRTLPRYLTEAQMAQLLQAPGSTQPAGLRDRAILEVLYATGLRASELCSLQVRDVTDRLVFVRCGKGQVQRYVPISRTAFTSVCDYLRAYPASADEPLFRTGPRQPMTRRRLHKALAAYERGLGFPTGVHLLRHAAATRWLNHGLSIRQVQWMLGHAQLATTAVYLRVATDALIRDYRRCLEPRGDGASR